MGRTIRSAVLPSLLVLATCQSAIAAESWNCNGKDATGLLPKDTGLTLRYDIAGDWLERTMQSPMLGSDYFPVPNAHNEEKVRTVPTRFRIIANTDVGIVAVSVEVRSTPQRRQEMGANVILLNKTTGAFREAGVISMGTQDFAGGLCKRN